MMRGAGGCGYCVPAPRGLSRRRLRAGPGLQQSEVPWPWPFTRQQKVRCAVAR